MVARWLAWRELWSRKSQFVGSAALIAAAVALFAGTELVARAREVAVAAQMDFIAPSLRLTAVGVTSTDLARLHVGDRILPQALVTQLRAEHAHEVRSIWARLVRAARIDGASIPVIGMPTDGAPGSIVDVANLGSREVLVGRELARRMMWKEGDRLTLWGNQWRVAGLLPPLGSAEDGVLFTGLTALQRATGARSGINEIRIYAHDGVSPEEIAVAVARSHPELVAHGTAERGDTAERQTGSTLRRHRGVVFALMALGVAIALAIAAHINAGERRVEMAMLMAMGGSQAAILWTLTARAAMVGVTGALVGCVLGAFVAILQDTSVAARIVWSWTQPTAVVVATVFLSVLAAIPTSLHAVYQDHVRALQE